MFLQGVFDFGHKKRPSCPERDVSAAAFFRSALNSPTYFFLAVAGFLVAGFAAGLAAPVLALVDLAAGFAAGLAVDLAAPVLALVDLAAAGRAALALVDDFAAVLFATIPRFLHGDMLWHQS